MALFTDQLHRTIELANPPKRIVSLVPSQTELLYDLGLENEVVGITKFCVHPEKWFRQKQRVGGTKNIHLEKLLALEPDLVLANREENVKEQIEAIAGHVPVWVSDVHSLDSALDMMKAVGQLTNRLDEAKKLITEINGNFQNLRQGKRPLKTAYLIWKDPYMTAGGDTYIHDLLSINGFLNIYKEKTRYPAITPDELRSTGCELLLLSSEPFPFRQKHLNELQLHLPETKILLVDGEMFSWYGSRLRHAVSYFHWLHSQIEAML